MKAYNIYYKHKKINVKPLKDNDIKEITKNEFIFKQLEGSLEKIPVKNINIIKCTVL